MRRGTERETGKGKREPWVARAFRVAPLRLGAEHLPMADSLERVGRCGHAGGQESLHLAGKIRVEKRIDARGEAAGQHIPRQVEAELQRTVPFAGARPRPFTGQQCAPRLAGGERQLQRANDPLPVFRPNAGGALRVEPREKPVQAGRSGAGEQGPQAPTNRFVPWRRRHDALEEPTKVHAGPAGHNRQSQTPEDRGDRGVGVPYVVGDGVVVPGVGHVDQPVRHALPLVSRGLCGRRVDAAVDLKGVAAHHLPTEALGDTDGEPRFAGPRRTAQEENRRPGGGAYDSFFERGEVRVWERSRVAFTVDWR